MAAITAAVALLSRIFLGERIRGRVLAAIGCAVLGIVLLALAKDGSGTPTAPASRWTSRAPPTSSRRAP
jgi:drug/metabolite transporter (DMT)-like permease